MVLRNHESPDECALRFTTLSYVDPDGDKSLLVVCRIQDEGRYLEFFTPRAYDSGTCRFKAAFFAAMLQVAFRTKYVQLEHDPDDGEVRYSADIPVMDGTVTAAQAHAVVMSLAGVCEEYHPVLAHAMATGKIDLGLRWTPPSDTCSAPPKPAPLPAELHCLIERMGGIEQLEALLASHRTAGGDR